jgi:hypothetical protein
LALRAGYLDKFEVAVISLIRKWRAGEGKDENFQIVINFD